VWGAHRVFEYHLTRANRQFADYCQARGNKTWSSIWFLRRARRNGIDEGLPLGISASPFTNPHEQTDYWAGETSRVTSLP